MAKTQGSIAVPAIVTLYKDKIDFIDGVPIVPIFQFNSFIDEFYGNSRFNEDYRKRLVIKNKTPPIAKTPLLFLSALSNAFE